MSLAMKGPETMTSIVSLPLTKDQGAIDPFEWRTLRPLPSVQIIGAADHGQRERRRQTHRDHIGFDELAEPDAGVKSLGSDIDQVRA
jgi:hypothetical protein